MRVGPSPSASRAVAARMLAETLPVKLAARYGSRLGIISRNIIEKIAAPESWAILLR